MNASLRENVLFGSDFVEDRYLAALEADPVDLLVASPSCGPWSVLQEENIPEVAFAKQVEHYPTCGKEVW